MITTKNLISTILNFAFFSFILLSCSPVKFNVDNKKVSPSTVDQTCKGDDCVYVWKADLEWGDCSLACGTGTQARKVVCVDTKQNVVPDENCPEAKPNPIQECNKQSCTDAIVWNAGQTWTNCSVSCGGGTQTRIVTCQKNSEDVDDSECSSAGTKPSTTQACNVQTCAGTLVDKTTSVTVPSGSNKVDILLILDDSESMLPDNLKLAERLNGFVTDLKNINIDWNMCVTTTDTAFYQGRPLQWTGINKIVIDKSTPELNKVFQQTIFDLSPKEDDPFTIGSNDERGIKAAIQSFNNNSNSAYHCYRDGAAIAYIIISDEDERSVGGNKNLSNDQFFSLENDDFPTALLSVLGDSKRVSANSIVVKDKTCKAKQDSAGSPSHIGTKYIELSKLTNGYTGSICDRNYSKNLNYFKSGISNSMSKINLECNPHGTPTVTLPSGFSYKVSGSEITFTPVLPQGTQVTIKYKCEQI